MTPSHSAFEATVLNTSLSDQARMDALLEAYQSDQPIAVDVLASLLENASESTDLRGAAALVLGKLASQPAMAVLLQQRHHPDEQVRLYVIQALTLSGRAELAAPALVDALSDSSNKVFASAAEGLGQLGRNVEPLLCDVLATGAEDARCVAAWQLGELRSQSAIPQLVQQARHNPNPDIQALCIWALGEIGQHHQAVMDMLKWARRQQAPEIRLRAETALKKIVRHVN